MTSPLDIYMRMTFGEKIKDGDKEIGYRDIAKEIGKKAVSFDDFIKWVGKYQANQ